MAVKRETPSAHEKAPNKKGRESNRVRLEMANAVKEEVEDYCETDVHIEKDAWGIWKNMQLHHNHLSLKKRYLMGLCTRDSLYQSVGSNIGNQSALPESLLRKDDLFYDDVKILVERCFRGCNVDTQQWMPPADVNFTDLRNMSRPILTLLDDFSNTGLYNLAKLFSNGMVTFVKTRPKMKKFVKSSLLAIQSNQYSTDQASFQYELSQLLTSSHTFRKNYRKHVKLTLKSLHADTMKVLDGVKYLNFRTLTAMHRKLKAVERISTRLDYHPSRKPKELLVKQVRSISLGMIQKLGESDELQEPLSKALAGAALCLKMRSCSQDLPASKFLQLTPGMKMLQDEIVKAIHLLDQRIRKEEMNKLRHLLDPNSKAEGKSLKSAIRNMLTDLLFEWIDMDAAPDSLVAALSLINKRSTFSARRSLSKDLMNEDEECILNVSANLKQLLWDGKPNTQLDQDFVDAYMDEGEESDDGDIFDDSDDDQKLRANSINKSQFRFNDLHEEVGSTSYADDRSFISISSTHETNWKCTNAVSSSKLADDVCSNIETSRGQMLTSKIANNGSIPVISSGLVGCSTMNRQDVLKKDATICSKLNLICGHGRNHYVAIQEVCDNTSMVAFQLIGHVLSEFGQSEALGLDLNEESYLQGGNLSAGHSRDPIANVRDKDVSSVIFTEAVHKVLPSFSKSELEMVKMFMSL